MSNSIPDRRIVSPLIRSPEPRSASNEHTLIGRVQVQDGPITAISVVT
jgi:hypothetical protein